MNVSSFSSRARPILAGELPLLLVAALSLGCASYRTSAATAQPSAVVRDGHWILVPHFPLVLQRSNDDCGAAALSAVLRFWGYARTPEAIEATLGPNDRRLQAGQMEAYARGLGLRSYVFSGTMTDVVYELRHGRPVIVGLGKVVSSKSAVSHYEVVVGYEPTKKRVLLLDPGRGWQTDGVEGFAREWALGQAVTIVTFLPAADGRSASP